MTLRIALRSFAAQPVRSAVLACGFGAGIACMAGLLGVGEVILEQSRSPHLRGGGDAVVYGAASFLPSARFLASSVLATPALVARVTAAAPSRDATLYLVADGSAPLALRARGGIPSLERRLGDPEIGQIEAWRDTARDGDWAVPQPASVLRAMDRFHPIPDVPARADSWVEWLYFNGRAADARFYLTFSVGPRTAPGRRRAAVRLQLERDGTIETFVDGEEVDEEAVLADAPDLRIGGSAVRLDGVRYRIALALRSTERKTRSAAPEVTGEITLEAAPGNALPPIEIGGAGGWVSGYVVPVLAGDLGGHLDVRGQRVAVDGGTGYHDHNWGFWEGVTWQWGQVADADTSLIFGRIRPPADAADAERIPGFVAALGPAGPLGFATDVTIEERDDPQSGRPTSLVVRGRGASLDLRLELDVRQTTATAFDRPSGSASSAGEFLQMRARYRVKGRIGEREVDFTADGAAETFRGGRGS